MKQQKAKELKCFIDQAHTWFVQIFKTTPVAIVLFLGISEAYLGEYHDSSLSPQFSPR